MTGARKEAERLMGQFGGYKYAILAAKEVVKQLNSIPKYATCEKFYYKKKLWNEIVAEIENI